MCFVGALMAVRMLEYTDKRSGAGGYMRGILVVLMVLAVSAVPAAAQMPAPHVKIAAVTALPVPLPYPYDEKADANAALASAFARAKANGKRVLIDMGGKWCPDCRILAGIMGLAEMKQFLGAHYEIVMVDVGMFDKNLQIPARFGIKKLEGVPTVVIAQTDGKDLECDQFGRPRRRARYEAPGNRRLARPLG